jgi:hypothetical protein
MSDPVVVAALAAAGGVVIGSLVSSIGVLFRERVVSHRERADRRAAFQRETILALQDAMGEYRRMVWVALEQAHAYKRETGHRLVWTTKEVPLPDGYSLAYGLVSKLRARTFDDDLRKTVGEIQGLYNDVVFRTDTSLVTEVEDMARVSKLADQMEERVNVLLRKLF